MDVVALPDHGNVYPTFHASDEWGTLEVESGALMNDSYDVVTVVAPAKTDGKHIAGDGWKLELANGWQVVPADGRAI